jgi:hypothetical protein
MVWTGESQHAVARTHTPPWRNYVSDIKHTTVHFERAKSAGILGFVALRFVSSVDNECRNSGWKRHHLVRIDSIVERVRLLNCFANGPVRVDAVNGYAAHRMVVSVQDELSSRVDAHVDRAPVEWLRTTVLRQGPIWPDGERTDVVVVRLDPRATVAGRDVEVLSRRMWPRILNFRRNMDAAPSLENARTNVDLVLGQDVVDGAIQEHLPCHVFSKSVDRSVVCQQSVSAGDRDGWRAQKHSYEDGVNIGIDVPFSDVLKTAFTRWPIFTVSKSTSTMFVITTGPSSSATYAMQ